MFLNTLKQVEHLKRICFPLDEEDFSPMLLSDDELDLVAELSAIFITINAKYLTNLTVETLKIKIEICC